MEKVKSLKKVFITQLFLVLATAGFSQLKIGTAPTQILKSSILQLESDRQGFLLPRLTDTISINTLTPPDGMLIYLSSASTTARGVYLRKFGIWQRLTTDSITAGKWAKTGDVLAGTEKLGSLNAQTLRFITNNIERMNFDGVTGNGTISKSLTVTDTTSSRRLIVTDTVKFKNLNRSTALTEILVIDTLTGSIMRRTIATDAFKNWITGPFSQTTNPYGISRKTGTNGTDTLMLHAASVSTPGGVSTTTQTFGGNKTFNDSLVVMKGSTLNSGTMANGGMTVSGTGATPATSQLTLGFNASTTADTVPTKYLSVNAIGQVTLNAVNIITNQTLKVRAYSRELDGTPMNLNNTSDAIYKFTIPGQNFSLAACVVVSPMFTFKLGVAINYARVVDANTIEISMTNRNAQGQPFTHGTNGTFNITVIEF